MMKTKEEVILIRPIPTVPPWDGNTGFNKLLVQPSRRGRNIKTDKALIWNAANDIHRTGIELSRQYDPRVVLPHTDTPVKADVVVKDVIEFERYISENPTKLHDDSDYGANLGGLIP